MTLETEARDVLLRAAAEIDVEPPPIAAMLGSAARRRRRIAAVVAGLSAAAVVVAVAVVSTGGDGSGAPVTARPTPLTTPPGTRLVGMNGVMVSVPEAWTNDRVKCGTPIGDTVIWDTGAIQLCQIVPTPEVSVLQIADVGQNNSALPLAQQAREPVTVGGLDAYRMPTRHFAPSCPVTGPGGKPFRCPYPRYEGTLYIPSLAVVMFASSPNRGVVDPILDSVKLIPDRYVAIPPSTTANELKALGLEVDLRGDLGPDRVAPTMPGVGTIVALGSMVTVGGVLDNLVPDSPTEVSVSKPLVECGSTGGPAMSVLVRSPIAQSVRVEVFGDSGRVGGSDYDVRAGFAQRVFVDLSFPPVDRIVDVTVRPSDGGAVLGRLDGVDLHAIPRSYEVCY